MRGWELAGYEVERADEVLTTDALDFVTELEQRFGPTRRALLAERQRRMAEIAAGARLDVLDATADVRRASWTVAPAPADLVDRRTEITGPTDRKMAINALNSGARVWLADFEDANTPTWANMVGGQVCLLDAVRDRLTHTTPEGRSYEVHVDRPATIVARPRGWHLDERHLLVGGAPATAALVDFGLYFFHNAAAQLARGSGPYFYLPKMESHLEARLWNDIFTFAEQAVGVPHGSVRATVLIETIPAAFEMEEILFELREHASGLNAGRWDYLFSIVKTFRTHGADYVLPDRNTVAMTVPCMRSYTDLLVQTCHRRGAFAIGGMAAFIPNRRQPELTEVALAKVRQDKEREAADGFDGSWVAHPDLVPICDAAFGAVLGDRPNQLDRAGDATTAPDGAALLDVRSVPGQATLEGLRNNVGVALRYLETWLRGQGAVAVFNLMEDVATAEIARSQIWQWRHNQVVLAEGTTVTEELVRQLLAEELAGIEEELGPAGYQGGRWDEAREVLEDLALGEDFVEFLTHRTYHLVD